VRFAAAFLTLALLEAPAAQTVRIDVLAADARGRSIESLQAADFDVRDEGVPQTLESARFVKADPETPRLIAVFLDEYHVSPAATPRVREAMERMLAEQVRPRDLLVVMKPLDSIFAIKLSAERDAAKAAIASFEGRRGEYEPRSGYERNFMADGHAQIETARSQVALSALNALAIHFTGYPDQRKTLIVVSEGLARLERRRGLEYLASIETVTRSAQQSNVAVYAVNPAAESLPEDTLAQLASDTVGRVISIDTPEHEAGLLRVFDDASGYYLLTYRASRPEDGRFHPVQVQLKKKGVELRARRGYYGPSPDEALRKALLARANEPKVVPPLEPAPHASPLIRPWFGTSRGTDGKTRVTFVWEPNARSTGERMRRVPTRVKVTALAPDGAILFEGTVLPTGPGTTDDSGAGAASRAVFEMPPGRLRTRMAILDAAETVIDTDVRSLSIRDMQRGVAIATPEVLRARNAREFRALDSVQAVPVSSREFSRTERLLIRFSAFGPDGSPVAVSARLLSRMGPMRPLTVADDPVIAGTREIDVSLAGLAAGDYLIEVHATGPAGDAKDVIDFRVIT
jgi:VWFA-related protein